MTLYYEKAAPYYSNVRRKSIDPVILIKMLLVGYLYGTKSERWLEEEISMNIIQKRGLQNATEECLLFAMALSLKD